MSRITDTPTSTPIRIYRLITWKELMSFITTDRTNFREYDIEDYVCIDFSMDLVANAKRQNIEAWIISISFYDRPEGHAFVAFRTTDKGVVYIEPQGDTPYHVLEVGKYLCDYWGRYECMGIVKSIERLDCDSSSCVSSEYNP